MPPGLDSPVDVPSYGVDNTGLDYHHAYGADPSLAFLGVASHGLLNLKFTTALLLGVWDGQPKS